MPCYFPNQGTILASGSKPVFLSRIKHDKFLSLSLKFPEQYKFMPCHQCKGCRLERSRQWAMRCMHEASLYPDNCFLTLTYDDDHLPKNRSLDKEAMPSFIKRLRRYADYHYGIQGIRFYQAGEYGDKFDRPHYHALIFNFDFPDKVKWKKCNGNIYYISQDLQKLWSYGFALTAALTFESAAYVARYCTKKITGDAAASWYTFTDPETDEILYIESEHCTMSRKGGIGKGWYDKFYKYVYNDDSVIVRNRAMKPPKFYDTLYKQKYPEAFAKISNRRLVLAAGQAEHMTEERLKIRHEKKLLDTKKLIRVYESGESQ